MLFCLAASTVDGTVAKLGQPCILPDRSTFDENGPCTKSAIVNLRHACSGVDVADVVVDMEMFL